MYLIFGGVRVDSSIYDKDNIGIIQIPGEARVRRRDSVDKTRPGKVVVGARARETSVETSTSVLLTTTSRVPRSRRGRSAVSVY